MKGRRPNMNIERDTLLWYLFEYSWGSRNLAYSWSISALLDMQIITISRPKHRCVQGHDYGGLSEIDFENQRHYPWEDRFMQQYKELEIL